MIRSLMMRAMLALAMFVVLSMPAVAQIDPAARGLAVQARTLAIGRDERVATSISDSRGDAIFIDASQYALNMRSALVWAKQLSGGGSRSARPSGSRAIVPIR